MTAAGNITTAIGDGTQGFAGDGGPAAKVEMSLPTGVQVDSSGNLYFADSLNNRIRKLAGGNVSTIAGNGALSHSGDGLAATAAQLNTPLGVAMDAAGNIYVADTLNNVVRRVGTNGVITPFAGTGVEYTELPMLYSPITFFVLPVFNTAMSPSSSPR